MTSTERKAGLGDVSERGPESAALPKGGEKEEGLWWAAPPPRGTDKGTLAHLRVAYNAVIAAAARCDDVDMAEELFKEVSHRQGKGNEDGSGAVAWNCVQHLFTSLIRSGPASAGADSASTNLKGLRKGLQILVSTANVLLPPLGPNWTA